jgi:hypothetical protein
MAVEWSASYLCSICNVPSQVVNVLEESIDGSGNPFRKVGKNISPSISWIKNKG